LTLYDNRVEPGKSGIYHITDGSLKFVDSTFTVSNRVELSHANPDILALEYDWFGQGKDALVWFDTVRQKVVQFNLGTSSISDIDLVDSNLAKAKSIDIYLDRMAGSRYVAMSEITENHRFVHLFKSDSIDYSFEKLGVLSAGDAMITGSLGVDEEHGMLYWKEGDHIIRKVWIDQKGVPFFEVKPHSKEESVGGPGFTVLATPMDGYLLTTSENAKEILVLSREWENRVKGKVRIGEDVLGVSALSVWTPNEFRQGVVVCRTRDELIICGTEEFTKF
jgi:hypothetical protein